MSIGNSDASLRILVSFICTHCGLACGCVEILPNLLSNFPTRVGDGGFELLNSNASSK
jgi:hypothetical protein